VNIADETLTDYSFIGTPCIMVNDLAKKKFIVAENQNLEKSKN